MSKKDKKSAGPERAQQEEQKEEPQYNKDWLATVWLMQLKQVHFADHPSKQFKVDALVGHGIMKCTRCGSNDVLSLGVGETCTTPQHYTTASLSAHWCGCGNQWITDPLVQLEVHESKERDTYIVDKVVEFK